MIVRFVQRWASFFAILAGLISYRLILPDDTRWWVELATALAVTIGVYLLLSKAGVTGSGPKRR
jgi:hypothetical protein